MLLVLTVADIRAVGPNVWTAYKAALLRDLYWRTEEVLSGGVAEENRKARIARAKEELAEALAGTSGGTSGGTPGGARAGWTKKDIKAHLARGYGPYWLSVDRDTHLRHAALVREAERAGQALTVDTRIDRYREVTEVTIYAADHPGLFSRIAGAMAVAGASIDAARIFTLANGMALDTFYVRNALGGPFDRPEHLARLKRVVEQTLVGSLKPSQELARRKSPIPSRLRVFKVTPRVLIDNKASARATVIEVNGRDRPGLLYDLTRALSKLQLMIHGARITTYGERAIDVFYVQDALGDKIEAPARLKRIRARLLEALGAPEPPATAKKSAEKPEPTKQAKKKTPAKKKALAKVGALAKPSRARPGAAE
jgi:[protein-PII] uridylyltransferase